MPVSKGQKEKTSAILIMAPEKLSRWTRWILYVEIILCLVTVVAKGIDETDDAGASRRNLISEFFLPVNPANLVDAPISREKRDLEGSGDDEKSSFSERIERHPDGNGMTNFTVSTFEKLIESNGTVEAGNEGADFEGSGDVDGERGKDKNDGSAIIIIGESENLTTERTEVIDGVATTTEPDENAAEVAEEKMAETETTAEAMEETATEVTPVKIDDPYAVKSDDAVMADENQTTELSDERTSTEKGSDVVTNTDAESEKPETTIGIVPFINSISTTPSSNDGEKETIGGSSSDLDSRTVETAEVSGEEKSSTSREVVTFFPVVPGSRDSDPESETPRESIGGEEEEEGVTVVATQRQTPTETTSGSPATAEDVFTETKLVHKTLEASPGNILHKKNMTLGVDPLIIVTNTGMMEETEEETGHMTSGETRRLGAYVIIAVIVLSFASLVGYIMLRKRSARKRLDFEKAQECNDTEKALLGLNDYKDNSEPEESILKNNEKSPIVVKSNAKINRFEKNTNFSSPKNLNTAANEKNLEKDNVLKSTTENLTQAIIEDFPKESEVEEEKNSPDMEKLIVKTRIDQDSIPKKPIIVNRSSTGYVPIPQDNL